MRQGLLRQIVMYLMLGGHIAAIFAAPVLIANFSEALSVSLTILPVTAAIIMFNKSPVLPMPGLAPISYLLPRLSPPMRMSNVGSPVVIPEITMPLFLRRS